AHNPKVVGSNPAPATKHQRRSLERVAFFVCVVFLKTFSDRELRVHRQKNHTYLTHLPVIG
ncbi:hypothetical protein ACW9IB_29535, partial [Pseudomonas sp. SDO524_S393]